MDQMPEYKEGFINMPKDGGWISVPVSEIESFMKSQMQAELVGGSEDGA